MRIILTISNFASEEATINLASQSGVYVLFEMLLRYGCFAKKWLSREHELSKKCIDGFKVSYYFRRLKFQPRGFSFGKTFLVAKAER